MKLFLYIVGGLAAIVVLAVAGLLIMGSLPGASNHRASVEISLTPDQVWPWLQEGEKMKSWVDWLVEVRPAGHQKTVWVMKDPNMGGQLLEIEGTVTEQIVPRKLVVHMASTGFSCDYTYTLTPVSGTSTRLDVNSEVQLDQWFARLLKPIVMKQAGDKLQKDLERLKANAERQRAASSMDFQSPRRPTILER